MTQSQSLGWGETKGEAAKNGLPFMKFQKENQFRIISGVIPRYVYWVNNAEGKPRTFECLAFDRQQERFNNSVKDPVREMGLTQKGEGKDAGKMVPLKCKRAYIALAINRETGQVEAIDLKKSIFDGIISTASELEMNPGEFIQTKDIFVQKTGSTWSDTKYIVQSIKCSKYTRTPEQDAEDQKLIDACDSIDSLYPRPTYDEVKQGLEAWLSGNSAEKDTPKAQASSVSTDEAINELED